MPVTVGLRNRGFGAFLRALFKVMRDPPEAIGKVIRIVLEDVRFLRSRDLQQAIAHTPLNFRGLDVVQVEFVTQIRAVGVATIVLAFDHPVDRRNGCDRAVDRRAPASRSRRGPARPRRIPRPDARSSHATIPDSRA